MGHDEFTDQVKKLWDAWNLRGCIMLSLSLQAFLVLIATFRQRRRSAVLRSLIWLAYLLADWVAAATIGSISRAQAIGKRKPNDDDSRQVLSAFWASFLLVHLGGPDTITSFALEDNEFWVRHLFGLLLQGAAAGYTFFMTFKGNNLWPPTLLVLIVGVIKYGERIRALYLASLDHFGSTIIPPEDPGPDYEVASASYSLLLLQQPIQAEMITVQSNIADAGSNLVLDLADEEIRLVKMANRSASVSDSESDSDSDSDSLQQPIQAEMSTVQSNNVSAVAGSNLVLGDEISVVKTAKRSASDSDSKFDSNPDSDSDSMQQPIQDESTVQSINVAGDAGSKLVADDEIRLVKTAKKLFDPFKGVIVGLYLTTKHREQSRSYFLELDYKCAFRLIEYELSFMYHVLHTKTVVARSPAGYTIRIFCFFSVVGSLVYYRLAEKSHVHGFEIGLTYSLLYGAIALDVISFIKLFFSDWTLLAVTSNSCAKRIYSMTLFQSKWSKMVSQYNMVSYCVDEPPNWLNKLAVYLHASDILTWIKIWRHSSLDNVTEKLEEFIFEELKRKSDAAKTMREALEASLQRGGAALAQSSLPIEIKLKWTIGEFQYAESLLLWHIATEICCWREEKEKEKEKKKKEEEEEEEKEKEKKRRCRILSDYMFYLLIKLPTMLSPICCWREEKEKKKKEEEEEEEEEEKRRCRVLSDYMFYLLIKQPTMLSPILGNWNVVFQDTFAEGKRFFNKYKVRERSDALDKLAAVKAKFRPAAVKGLKSKSIFFDSCILAQQLWRLEGDERWKVMDRIWAEFMCYAAVNCKPIVHAQQLSLGGELLTMSWAMMSHLGLGLHFSEEDQAGTKMVAVK